MIGAGSGFGGRLSIDIMSRESLRDCTICLCDLHEGRLKEITEYIRNIIEKYHLPTRLESGTDRTKLLPGADFVITSISVGEALNILKSSAFSACLTSSDRPEAEFFHSLIPA